MIRIETVADHYDKDGLSRFYSERREDPKNKDLSIPQLRIGGIDQVRYSTQYYATASSGLGNLGLENNIRTNLEGSNTSLYIVDNHQYAFFAWCEAILEGNIDKEAILLHFDEHDDATAVVQIVKTNDLAAVYDFVCSLWEGDFIFPAVYNGLMNKVYWISPTCGKDREQAKDWIPYHPNASSDLGPLRKIGMDNQLIDQVIEGKFASRRLIVDIDLDYFYNFNLSTHEDTRYSQDLVRSRAANNLGRLTEHDVYRLRNVMQRAGLITVATSPGYINEADALEALHLLFNSNSFSPLELQTKLQQNPV